MACKLLVAACGILLPDQGLNPSCLCWKRGVLATGLPGKSPRPDFNLTLLSAAFQSWFVVLICLWFVWKREVNTVFP